MPERNARFRPGPRGCGFGCGSFLFVLVVGGALSIFNAAFGIAVSAGIPFTTSNVTAAGSIGVKEKVADRLPGYVRGRLGGNENFINNSTTVTVGPAEGAGVLVIGAQAGAPALDLYIDLR